MSCVAWIKFSFFIDRRVLALTFVEEWGIEIQKSIKPRDMGMVSNQFS